MSKLNNLLLRIFFYLLFVVFFSASQLAVGKVLPYPFNNFDFLIIILVFVLFIFNKRLALLLALGLGLIMDFYYFPSIGINLAAFFITLLLTDFLLVNFFTDKSLYSLLALVSSAYLTFYSVFYFFNYLVSLFTKSGLPVIFNRYFFVSRVYGWLLSLLTVSIVFYIFNYISKRYQPFFLTKKIR